MHEIFINYRTRHGKEAAARIDAALSARFGQDAVFRAQKSIELGADYAESLLRAVRRSRVLLALIDTEWLDAPDRRRPGRRALNDPGDWVRRELEEAFECAVVIVPVLLGRRVEQLPAHRLPRSLARLADCQYERVTGRAEEHDLLRLGDRLVRQIPALTALDGRGPQPGPDEGTGQNVSRPAQPPGGGRGSLSVSTDRQSGGVGAVGGDIGTFMGDRGTYVNEAHGPLHSGSGDLHQDARTMTGSNVFGGDNHGGVHQRIGRGEAEGPREDRR